MGVPVPYGEKERLEILESLKILDTPPEEFFDCITRIASQALDMPIVLVSLIDEKRQWFKSKVGIDAAETPREMAFCAHAICQEDILIVEDANKDERFASNPLVTDDPKIRFYAGAQLVMPGGHKLGTLCAIDRTPRTLSEKQEKTLVDLSKMVVGELSARHAVYHAGSLYELTEKLLMAEKFANIGHWHLDLKGNNVVWSDQIYQIHGVTPEEYTPELETAIAFYHPDDQDKVRTHLDEAIELKKPFEFTLRLLRGSDGAERLVMARGQCEYDKDSDEPVSIFGVFHDVTEAARQAEIDQQRQKMESLGRMAGGVAHEINNLLQPISLSAEIIRDIENLPADMAQASLNTIIESAQMAGKVVEDVLAFTRTPEEKECTPLDVTELLQDTVEFVQALLPSTITIELSCPEVSHLTCRVNEHGFRQIMTNLLLNASHAMGRKGNVEITLSENQGGSNMAQGSFAKISVKDHGAGVPYDIQNNIFEPFFTTKEVGEGTGLGLAIVYGILKSWGADIILEESSDKGTTFAIYIPVVS